MITTSILAKVKVTTSHVLVMSRNQRSNLYICYCASSNITLATEMAEISHLFWANCELAKYDQLDASYNHHIWEEHVIIGESQVTKKGSPLSKIGSGIVETTEHSAISSCQLQLCTAVSNWN